MKGNIGRTFTADLRSGGWSSALLLAMTFAVLQPTSAQQQPPAQQPPAPPGTSAQPAPDTRDLKTIDLTQKTGPVSIPRSYALVIGIAKYKNLPDAAQLAYPNRDAEDIYTTLISAEGGQFPAENVHKLIDEKATIANIRHELEVWLPSVTKDDDREQSFESENWGGGHGIFTYYVVKGLEGEADTNGDGVVSADELAEYVHTNVRLATQAQQNPTSERGSFDPNMVLAYNPSHVKAANLPPPQFGSLIIESNMDDTEIWVDGKSAGMVSKGKPLRLPGIEPGAHTIKAVRMGYEPDGPREEQVYPGQDTTVSVRILIARQHNHSAVEHFDKGIEDYNKGSESNYKKAAEEFHSALALDPKYSQAALYLGRVENALFEDQDALAAFKMAIDTDPDYLEARASYAAALLEAGDLDEAVRQLNVVTLRQPDNGMGWYLLSQAYARKDDYADGKTAAEQAIRVTPKNAEAHFWLAQCLRLMNRPAEAETEYNAYLTLSDFDSGFGGKLNYYLAGYLFGAGVKRRAAQTDIWRELRGQANFGLCDCEYALKRYSSAIQYCQQALSYIPKDLYANYRLGLVYAQQFNQQNSVGLLAAAKEHFSEVVTSWPDTDEAGRSKKYLQMIDSALAKQP
jgi:tetratricopeptide (TPR) repeat protein